jgi:serine/threonine protein kinase
MNSDRWKRIADLYELACARPPESRTAFLRDQCGTDLEIFHEVQSLLRQDVSSDGILERVAEKVAQRALPATIGRYRIIDLIGEGGMGAVYKAEQAHPRRTVALKVIKPGLADADSLRRFDRESQALGRLQHPGIAPIYEADTADAGFGPQPYFAMEFIHGSPLLEYAGTHNLRTNARLELIAKICDAVQHAHGRGIIHRDLKPGNILVDETGQPKVLDFGVARIVDNDSPSTQRTSHGELIGTLAYMSPEQVYGDPLELDARSDVYTIGVLLYELLTGQLPYDVKRPVYEAVRIIQETEATPLGSINRGYRGDLETIVNKALEKDKSRRYASAADLAGDLRRYLNDEPILARPHSAGYNLKKLVTRHKALAGALVSVFAILVIGIIVSARETIRANQAQRAALIERDRADAAAATARALSEFLQNDLLAQASSRTQATQPNARPDPNLTVRAALDRAASRIGSQFASRPEVEAAIRQTIGLTYRDLSLFDEAQKHMQRALEIRRSLLGPEHVDTLNSMQELGAMYARAGNHALSEKMLMEVLSLRRRTGSDELSTFSALNELANAVKAAGDYVRSEEIALKALQGYIGALGEEHSDTVAIMSNLAVHYTDQGKYAQAAELGRRVVAIKQRVMGAEHPSTLLSMNNLAVVYRNEGKYDEAQNLLTTVLEARRRTLGDHHLDTYASMNSLALVYQAKGDYAKAQSLLVDAVDGVQSLLGKNNPDTTRMMNSLAELYRRQGKIRDAEALFAQVLEIRRLVFGPTHPNTTNVLASLGELNLSQRRYAAAQPLLREALSNYEKTNSNSWRRYYAQSMLGAALSGLHRYNEAALLLASGYQELLERERTIPFENQSVLRQARDWTVTMRGASGKDPNGITNQAP